MALQAENFLSGLHVPQLGSVVHGASSNEHTVRVEGESDDLHLVADEVVESLASVRVPNLRLPIEGPCHDLVSTYTSWLGLFEEC